MNSVQPSATKIRKRKLLLLFPFLIIPFLTLLFWAMGGGNGKRQSDDSQSNGLNAALPSATLKDEKGMDKLSFYDLAQQDSIKLAKHHKEDPFWDVTDTGSRGAPPFGEVAAAPVDYEQRRGQLRTTLFETLEGKPEDKLLQKIAHLQKGLEENAVAPIKEEPKKESTNERGDFTEQVDRLEGLMASMNDGSNEDPEIAQLQTTLETLLDVQHPERVQERLKEKSLNNRRAVFVVDKYKPAASVSLLDTARPKPTAVRFHSWKVVPKEIQKASIEAVVHETQTVVEGAVMKLRLLSDTYIDGTPIPSQTFVFGIASLRGERLEIAIPSIRSGTAVFPVHLEVVDLDGLPGIFIPGAITRDVAKQSASDAVGAIGIGALDPSLKTQAMNLGVGAARSLLQKNAKLVKVSVKAGYKVLLQNKS